MPSIIYMRDVVTNMYPGSSRWKNKVAVMSDKQVAAIFNREIQKKGKR